MLKKIFYIDIFHVFHVMVNHVLRRFAVKLKMSLFFENRPKHDPFFTFQTNYLLIFHTTLFKTNTTHPPKPTVEYHTYTPVQFEKKSSTIFTFFQPQSKIFLSLTEMPIKKVLERENFNLFCLATKNFKVPPLFQEHERIQINV